MKNYLVCLVEIVQVIGMKDALKNAKLYGIVDRGYVGVEDVESVTDELIKGGVDVIQLRAKGCAIDEVELMARKLVKICKNTGVPFIVNDYPEIAVRVGADGVHVGQDDGGWF